jgi:hypothetical protein
MSHTDSAVVTALDAKIAELEREAEKLQNMIQRLAAVSANLDALRKARAVMADEHGDGDLVARTNGSGASIQKPLLPIRIESKTDPALRPPLPGSIGFIAIEVLRRAAKPLPVAELLPLIQAEGKSKLSQNTLVSTLCGYVISGRLKRPSPSVYSLP